MAKSNDMSGKPSNTTDAQLRATQRYSSKTTRRTVVFNPEKPDEAQILKHIAADKQAGNDFSVTVKKLLVLKYKHEKRWQNKKPAKA